MMSFPFPLPATFSSNRADVKYINPDDDEDVKIAPPTPVLPFCALQDVKLDEVMLNSTEVPKNRPPTRLKHTNNLIIFMLNAKPNIQAFKIASK
jgi:hypothetical protein